jgi:hypothetical protein
MSRMFQASLLHAALLTAIAFTAHAAEFVYQGQLDDRGVPANGRYDLRIAAYGDEKSAAGLMTPIEFPAVEVKDGRFELRFDAPLARAREAWLEVAVRDVGAGNFATIPGRSKAISAPLIGACWSSTGDSGSNPATNFLGTTDAQPLVIKTANVQSLRIEPSSVLSGGNPITANVIAGSSGNNVTEGVRGATIAGGGVSSYNVDPDFNGESPNRVFDHYGSIGGGYANTAGGGANAATDRPFATVTGGLYNTASGGYSGVGSGRFSRASGDSAFVGGGDSNEAAGDHSTVGGGYNNAAQGTYAVVGGGYLNCAGGNESWAGGYRAKVRTETGLSTPNSGCFGVPPTGTPGGDVGTFIWADSRPQDFVSTGPDQFLVRANGGFMLNTTTQIAGYDDVVLRSSATTADPDLDLRLITRSGKDALIYLADGTGSLVFRPNGIGATFDRLQVEGGMGGTAALDPGLERETRGGECGVAR